jgi:Helix-turn-helix domain
MDNIEAIVALSALAQATRLDTFRLLVKKEPGGVPAGELARLMAVPQNTMSAHLAILARAGLVIDFAFTLCDDAAGETCPAWPGQPMTAHWGIEDPAAVEGTDIDKERAFAQAFRYLRNRITAFIALPIKSLDRISLTARLHEIGTMEGATRVLMQVKDVRHG